MKHLQLSFSDGRIYGSGTGVIGPFTFEGVVTTLVSEHDVEYAGMFHGEGTMYGKWRIEAFSRK